MSSSKILKHLREHGVSYALLALIATTQYMSWPESAGEWREFFREIAGGAAVVLAVLWIRKEFYERNDPGGS